jgi:ankyrin repeat protein
MEQKMTEAVLRNDIKQVKTLLSQGASPNSLMPTSGAPVLSIPIVNNNLEMVKLFIGAGANVNMKDSYGMPLLHLAKRAPMIRLLLQSGADMYALNKGRTAFEYLADLCVSTEEDKRKGRAALKSANLPKNTYDAAVRNLESGWITGQDIIDVVNVYRDFKYDVNRTYLEEKRSLLLIAAWAENYEFITAVISATNADVNIRNAGDVSIINVITADNKTKRSDAEYEALLSLMMKKGLLIDAICKGFKDEKVTPLMIAANKNYYGRVKALIKAGAKPNVLNENRRTAINFATDLAIVKFLIDSGIDPLNRDKWQQTSIFGQKDVAVVELLLSKGVKVDDQDTDGQTALFSIRDPKLVEYLAKRGLDINHVDRKKRSAMEEDMWQILDALRFDHDVQDLFIPKFKTLMKLGIDRKHVRNAYDMAVSSNRSDMIPKVMNCIKSYAGK